MFDRPLVRVLCLLAPLLAVEATSASPQPRAQDYLKASNTDSFDGFGWSLAISGDTLVIGAPGEASGAAGVNGNQLDNSLAVSGAVYVFERTAGGWSQQAYIKASNPDAGDGFGRSVAISGDTLVVGALGESSSATGVNGNQLDNSAGSAGAAYVFVRNAGAWSQQAYLKASNTDAFDEFGFSVSIFGDTIVVGARAECSIAVGVNGNQTNNLASHAGAAYVFTRSGGAWSQQAYLKATNTDFGDNFGTSVAISGNTVVVGAWAEQSNATGVNGNQQNDSLYEAGAAYVYVRSGATWSPQAYLKASNTNSGDEFGIAVAISGGTIVVGADGEASHATGVNGDQLDNSFGYGAGAAYVFVWSAGAWSQQAYLKASNTGWDFFGSRVAIEGNAVVVGANDEASSATGVNGDQQSNNMGGSGAGYVFLRDGGVWSQRAYLKASNTDAQDCFGISLAISNDEVVLGAFRECSSAIGVNGNQADNSLAGAGAVYAFSMPGLGFTRSCFGDGSASACPCSNDGLAGRGCDNSAATGGAELSATGLASLACDTLRFASSGELPNSASLFLQGTLQVAPVPFGDGLRCTGGLSTRLYFEAALNGVATAPALGEPSVSARSAASGDVLAPGMRRIYQACYRDPTAAYCPNPSGGAFNVSSALVVEWAN